MPATRTISTSATRRRPTRRATSTATVCYGSTDPDDDEGGVADASDPDDFNVCNPNKTDPTCDFDGDGTPNSTDPDDDNDGVADASDPGRLQRLRPAGDRPELRLRWRRHLTSTDPDDDNDGVADASDPDDFNICNR